MAALGLGGGVAQRFATPGGRAALVDGQGVRAPARSTRRYGVADVDQARGEASHVRAAAPAAATRGSDPR